MLVVTLSRTLGLVTKNKLREKILNLQASNHLATLNHLHLDIRREYGQEAFLQIEVPIPPMVSYHGSAPETLQSQPHGHSHIRAGEE